MQHPNIQIIEGESSVLVSAPHAVPIVKTVNGRKYTRMAEKRVYEIVEKLNSKKNTWGIYTISEGPLEGWQEDIYKKYKKIVKGLIKTNDINLVLDIHGARRERPFFIDYDFILPHQYKHDTKLEKLFTEKFSYYFPKEKLSSGFYRDINGSGYKTLTYYTRKYLKKPAMQLEINKKLKDDDVKFKKLINMLNDFLEDYENTIAGVQQK